MLKNRFNILMEGADDGKGGTGSSGPALLETIIPAEFKEQPYLKDLRGLTIGPDAYAALFKKLDGAEKLIGKKTAIPEATAPDAEWDSFFARLRPETAEAYEFKDKDGKEAGDPEFLKAVKGIFHKAGVPKNQAAKIYSDFEALIAEKQAAQTKETERLDAEFNDMVSKAFTAENEKVLTTARKMIDEFTPDNLKGHIQRLPNESLVLMAGILNNIATKFIGEDKMNADKGGTQGTDEVTLRNEAKKIMASAEFSDFQHPGHDAAVKRKNEIYEQIGRMQAAAAKR